MKGSEKMLFMLEFTRVEPGRKARVQRIYFKASCKTVGTKAYAKLVSISNQAAASSFRKIRLVVSDTSQLLGSIRKFVSRHHVQLAFKRAEARLSTAMAA